MTSRIVRVGRQEQVITTTYSLDDAGNVHEHITLETPNPLTETQRLRLVQTWENTKEFPS
jgi:hypothetical protein